MQKKEKPPGKEKWTWEEIRLGRRLSKSEKRLRRMARHLGASENKSGDLSPPDSADQKVIYYLTLAALLIVSICVLIFFPNGCAS